MINITDSYNLKEIYEFQRDFETPYYFAVSFNVWKKSFAEDVDGEDRTLFKELFVKAVYEGDKMLGFVQYGKTAFGFDENGELSVNISYPVIRNLCFLKDRPQAGKALLNEAVKALRTEDRIYAFFHYFGMSCFARHGKLFEKHTHIDNLLRENGFEVEHENVYYSSYINGDECSEVTITSGELSKGSQQYLEFRLDGSQVGGCEVHFVDDTTAYLRWIYVNGDIVGKGIGTKCMNALKHFLCEKGMKRFDTDTALSNQIAQHYYEKNGFVREGITRSYYTK